MEIINRFILGITAFAQDAKSLIPCGHADANGFIATPCDYQQFLILIGKVFNYLIVIAIPLATAVIVYGGVKMVTAGSNDGKRSEAKGIIGTAVWGLVIVLSAYLIINTIFDALVKTEFKPLF